ncbi:hypothetical protein [Jatrophihabitans lederbergiae]|uniref:Uncharacterized protein n=1 Tax=Jatrophihabitans lederbergiae TaxID=3075547 RepID=A0ABU2JET2_9ACTN|nr:hypothetical protein [Jatrophihabitans sp. DSM 44399]MDT0263502.1 hypothetical protein [Jatrophihabitans sp. DSM 44399]
MDQAELLVRVLSVAKVAQELLDAFLRRGVALYLALPIAFGGVVDQLLFDGEACL